MYVHLRERYLNSVFVEGELDLFLKFILGRQIVGSIHPGPEIQSHSAVTVIPYSYEHFRFIQHVPILMTDF